MDIAQQRQAYELHLTGADAFDVASTLGCTVDEAESLVNSYASNIPSASAVEARRDEVKRVDVWLSRVNAEYLLKAIPIDKAVSAFVKLSERRSKLLGLDSPTRAEITAVLQATPSSVDLEIQSLITELGIADTSVDISRKGVDRQ